MTDSWGVEEGQIHNIGTYVIVVPPFLSALFIVGTIPIQIPISILLAFIAVCGIVGGAINILERGPLIAGAVAGMTMAVGSFISIFLWILWRGEPYMIELFFPAVLGAIPGSAMQMGLARICLGPKVAED